MKPGEIAEARAIIEAATEGDWEYIDTGPANLGQYTGVLCKGKYRIVAISGANLACNMQFIAAARDGWPAAVDEVERLQAKVAELRQAIVGELQSFRDERAGKTKKIEIDIAYIIEDYLISNGYDGLYTDDCACRVKDLIPCGENPGKCIAGHKVPCIPEFCEADGDCDYHIGDKAAQEKLEGDA